MPAAGFPAATVGLIIICVAVYIGGWDPDLRDLAWPWAAIGSLVLSASLLGLVVNMLFLWLFAESLENHFGAVRMLGFVVLCGLAAAGAQELADPDTPFPSVGIAGSIAGLICAHALVYPGSRILCWVLIPFFVTFTEIPALILAAAWLALQAIPEVGQPPIAGLVAGAAVGLAAGWLLARNGSPVAPEARAVS